jgi:hypothetical protein
MHSFAIRNSVGASLLAMDFNENAQNQMPIGVIAFSRASSLLQDPKITYS